MKKTVREARHTGHGRRASMRAAQTLVEHSTRSYYARHSMFDCIRHPCTVIITTYLLTYLLTVITAWHNIRVNICARAPRRRALARTVRHGLAHVRSPPRPNPAVHRAVGPALPGHARPAQAGAQAGQGRVEATRRAPAGLRRPAQPQATAGRAESDGRARDGERGDCTRAASQVSHDGRPQAADHEL